MMYDRYGGAENGVVTFAGSITPGSRSVTWWFDYGQVGQTKVFRQPAQPQKYVSDPVVAQTSSIVPFRGYWYQAVADDGGKPEYGNKVLFDAGNLTDPSGFSPAGPYNLFITCPTACSSPGLPVTPLTRFAAGELDIGGWNPQTYAFGGLIKNLVFFSQNGGGLPAEGNYLVAGSLSLGGVQFRAGLAGPSSNSPPPTFTLGGGADYGPPIQPGVALHFEPVLGGTLGGKNMWIACYQSLAPNGCAPPDHPDKSAAGVVAEGLSGAALATSAAPPVAAAFAVFGLIAGAISLDPPDRHFKHVARPLRVGPSHVSAGNGISARAARALTTVSTAFARSGADGYAFITAFQRYQGAADARNAVAVVTQLTAAIRYGHMFASDCRALTTMLDRLRGVLVSSPLGRDKLSVAVLNQALRSAHQHGLPAALTRQLERIGVPGSELNAYRAKIPTHAPSSERTALGTILSSQFRDQLRAYATGLNRYLNALP